MKIVIGLGNPGRRYARTRHNVGFAVVEHVARRWSIAVESKQHGALVGDGRIGVERAVLACPQSFMNVSGAPVASILGFYKLGIEDLVVVHDELELPYGEVQLKLGGGHKGHNGLRDVARHVGAEFARVRVGIGRPPDGWDVADYVLGRWTSQEEAQLDDVLGRAADVVEAVVRDGMAEAMTRFNPGASGSRPKAGAAGRSTQRSRRTTPDAPDSAREEL